MALGRQPARSPSVLLGLLGEVAGVSRQAAWHRGNTDRHQPAQCAVKINSAEALDATPRGRVLSPIPAAQPR